jgi:hypothetical protein
MIGTNEIAPVNTVEKGMIALIMLLSSILNTQIFGQISVLVLLLTRKSVILQE